MHLQHIRPLVTYDTHRLRRYDLERFVAHVGPDVAVKALKRSHILDWLAAQDVRASTLHLRFGTVRYFVRDCIRHGWMRHDPTLDIVLPRRPRKEPRALTLDELRALGTALPDARARLIIALSINEALRRVEICRLEFDDIDFASMRLRVLTAKNSSEDVLPLSHETHDNYLLPYLVVRGRGAGPLIRAYTHPGGLTPGSMGAMVSKWMRAAGIKEAPHDGRSLHAGRHTKASVLLDAGASPEIVQKYLRHSQMSSTWTYLRNRRTVEDLRPWSETLPRDDAA